MQPLQIVSTGLALLSLLLLLLALGSDHWLVDKADNHMGLWKICSPGCIEIISVPDYIDVTRAFLFLGVIAGGGVSSLIAITSFLRSHLGPVLLTLVSAVGSFSAGLCAMIAMAVFTAENAKDKNQAQLIWGWSFSLGWASFPLFLITGAVTMFIPKPPSS